MMSLVRETSSKILVYENVANDIASSQLQRMLSFSRVRTLVVTQLIASTKRHQLKVDVTPIKSFLVVKVWPDCKHER